MGYGRTADLNQSAANYTDYTLSRPAVKKKRAGRGIFRESPKLERARSDKNQGQADGLTG